MGMFYLIVIARTDTNSGKCWIGTKAHRLASPREHRTVSGKSGDGEAQAAAQHPWRHRERKDRAGTQPHSEPDCRWQGKLCPKVILGHPEKNDAACSAQTGMD